MARHKGDRPRTGRSVYVLGTSCGTLAVAAVVSAVYPVPYPVAADGGPAASREDVLSALDDVWFPIDESDPSGGPLEIPDIGVVLADYDARYAALEAARTAKDAADDDDDYDFPSLDDYFDDKPIIGSDWDDDSPVLPNNPIESLPAPSAPAPAVVPPPPPVAPAATPPPVTNAPPPPVDPTTPPATPPPPTTTPPPTEEPPPPPTEEPPPPPADQTLAIGQRYEHTNADGTVDFTITLVSVEADVACTAGSVPAENGHLLGLHVEVVDPEPPAISAADFRFLGADGVVTADVDTASSATCLENGWPAGEAGSSAPVQGTLVLDVPAVTGTVIYRPAAWPAGIRWSLPPAE